MSSRRAQSLVEYGLDLLESYEVRRQVPDLLAATRAFDEAITLMSRRDPERHTAAILACKALRLAYEATRDLSLLPDAVGRGQRVVADMRPADESFPGAAIQLSLALTALATATQDPRPARDAVVAIRAGLSRIRRGHPLLPDGLVVLTGALRSVHTLTGDPAALAETVTAGRAAVRRVPADSPLRAELLDGLSQDLRSRWERERDTAALDEAIDVGRQAAWVGRAGIAGALRQYGLSSLLRMRHDATQDVDVLREATTLLQQLCRDRLSAFALDARGQVFLDAAEALHRLADDTADEPTLQQAVGHYRAALGLTPRSSGPFLAAGWGMASALDEAFRRSGNLGALNEAVAVARDMVEATLSPGPRASGEVSLATMLVRVFHGTGDLRAVADAAEHYRRALPQLPDGAERVMALRGLYTALRERYNVDGDMASLRESCTVAAAVLTQAAADDPLRAADLFSHGSALGEWYLTTGDLPALDTAVDLLRQSVDLTPAGMSEIRARRTSSLAATLGDRYHRHGRIEDLREAICLVEADPWPPAPAHFGVFANLCGLRAAWFERTGDTAVLARALNDGRTALALRPEDPFVVSALATTLVLTYQAEGQQSALEEAQGLLLHKLSTRGGQQRTAPLILMSAAFVNHRLAMLTDDPERADRARDQALTLMHEALRLAPDGSAACAAALNNLGSTYLTRFERRGHDDDLSRSRELLSRAVRLGGDGSALAGANLAAAEIAAAERSAEPDPATAVRLARGAITATGADTVPSWADVLTTAARVLARAYELAPDDTLREEALACFSTVLDHEGLSASARLRAGRQAGDLAAVVQDWGTAVDLFARTVALLPRVVAVHLPRRDQESLAVQIAGLGNLAASTAIEAGDPRRAVELLEQGRGLLLAHSLDLRTDLTDLERRHPDHAERLRRLWRALESDSGPDTRIGTPLAGTLGVDARLELGRELAELLAEIRREEGFASFLTPRPAIELLRRAPGTVVVLNVSRLRTDALLLVGDDVSVVPLPDAPVDRVREMAQALWYGSAGTSTEDVLRWLWQAVTGPVLARLGIDGSSASDATPHLWWCPTDLLAFLPLHAARDLEAGEGRDTLDRVISSYTATLRVLEQSAAAPGASADQLSALVVSVPEVPGQAPLPSADLEADLVAERFPGAEVLRGEEATRDAVIDGMSRHNTVHFACHATSDPTEPSRSTLVLHDYASRPLTPLFMSRHRLDDMHLAYLSACSTTRTSELLREESIHLSSAFQLSGFRTVIGTLWPLNDAVAVRVVRQFYAGLGGEAGGSAAVALHRSVRLLRDERPDRPDLWAGLVHIGT